MFWLTIFLDRAWCLNLARLLPEVEKKNVYDNSFARAQMWTTWLKVAWSLEQTPCKALEKKFRKHI